MIVDSEGYDLVNAIEAPARGRPRRGHQARAHGVGARDLDRPVPRAPPRPARQLRALRAQVRETAGRRGLTIGSAGTHPFAMWEDQRIVGRDRYRDIVSALRFVARQELLFGMHVHVGVDDPDKAIHVANGMRVHIPVLLALSANSPFWRADASGLHSTRTPIFRAFPRVGIPPTYRDWERLLPADRLHGPQRGDRGLHLPLVRRAPAPAVRHRRDARCATPDPDRTHARPRGAHPGDGQGALRALRGRDAAVGVPVADARREQVARRPARPATGSLVDLPSSDRVRAAGSRPAPPGPAARARAGPRVARRPRRASTTCWRAARDPSASSRSTRPTTTCARSCTRSSTRPGRA